VAELIGDLRVDRVRENLERIEREVGAAAARAGREPGGIEILAAVKYVPVDAMRVLAEAGVKLLGENRAQDLAAKAQACPGVFTWDFIGHVQSRKVRAILPHVRLVHSVSSESVLEQLGRHGDADTEVLVEVNVAGEDSKSGVAPDDLAGFIDRCPVRVGGLMTMPPLAEDPEASRPHFAALRELAERHGLARLSMGTSQDFAVAVEEGATIVRLGSVLYGRPAG
jgi:pyridoxal phosphate enzyme (YggS family)